MKRGRDFNFFSQFAIILAAIIIALLFTACELGGPVQLPSYTIVYHANGGGGREMGNSTHVYGAAQNLRVNRFIHEGYHFIGWADAPAGVVKFTDGESVINLTKKDGAVINLYAVWEGNVYTVVYNANGGEGTMENSVFTFGVSQALRENVFIRAGFDFDGWARESGIQLVEFTDQQDVQDLTITETVTLYAQWKGNPYTLVYDANSGQGTMENSSFAYGKAYNLRLNTFTRDGYMFAGWATTAIGNVSYTDGDTFVTTQTVAGDTVTLYAKWEPGFTVTFNADGGDPAPANQIVVSGGKVTEPPAMTKQGVKITYAFDGWYKEAGLSNKWNFATDTVSGHITLYAKWREQIIMVWVPGGNFQMGNATSDRDNERPVRTVTLTAFYIGQYEVTQEQYRTVMGTNPSYFTTALSRPPAAGETDAKRPVERVSWFDAVEFCNKLSEREGLQPVYTISGREPATGYPITSATVTSNWSRNGYRLPTEAQWEYAARGGHGSPGNYTYAGSNTADTVAWYTDNSDGISHEVGMKAPNGLGIYDMSGNVYEWCWDWFVYYSTSWPSTDPTGASGSSYPNRILRGGGYSGTIGASLRSAYRTGNAPGSRFIDCGFRVVRP